MKPQRKKIRKLSSTESDSLSEEDSSNKNLYRKFVHHEMHMKQKRSPIFCHVSNNSSIESRQKKVQILSSKESDSSSEDDISHPNKNKKYIPQETDMKQQHSPTSGYDSDNSSIESMDIIMYPSDSVLLEIENSKRNNKKLENKDYKKEKQKDVSKRSSTEVGNKNEARRKRGKNDGIPSNKNDNPISVSEENDLRNAASKEQNIGRNRPRSSQVTSNKNRESLLKKHEKSYTATTSNKINQTKKSTVKKRPENYGSRMQSLLTDLKSPVNGRKSLEERKQRQTKYKDQCKTKNKEKGNEAKNKKFNENPIPQSSHSESFAEVEKDELSKDSKCKNKLGCSSKDENANESYQKYSKQPSNYCLTLITSIVNLDIKWLEEKEKHVLPPSNFSKDNEPLPLFFDSFEEYSRKYLSLLKCEIWEKICSSTKANLYKKNNLKFLLDSYKYTEGLMQLDCKSSVHAPAEKSLVIVQLKLKDGQLKSVLGFIETLECKKAALNEIKEGQHKYPVKQLFFKILVKSRGIALKKGPMEGKVICSLSKEITQAEAIYLMKSSPLLNDILQPSWNTFCTSYEELHSGDFFSIQQNISDVVNKEINLSPSNPKIMLLQGPPGSGKTYAIASIASNLLRCNEDLKKILIVAPSHLALDEISNQLLQLKELFDNPFNFVRLGHIENINPKLLDFSFHKYLEKYNQRIKNKGNTLDRIQQQKRNILNDIPLILAVPEDCWELRKLKVKFSCCFIDEINQGTELDTLYPFALGIRKFLLVADHMQLPAKVESKMAWNCGYQRSVMERFQQYFMQKFTKNPTIILSQQFRINCHIAEFPFKSFYSDYGLINCSHANKRSRFYRLRPYVVLDDRRGYETEDIKKGIDFIISICFYIIKEHAISSIGIIVPSDKEKHAYQAALQKTFMSSVIEVKTVDQFQGREKTVILLSCYHNFDKITPFHTDYFRDERKLNVALTRAVSTLIICGPLHKLMNYEIWKKIVTDSQSPNRNCYIGFESLNEIRLFNVLNI